MSKLNLGCGTDIRPGWINLDSAALPGVDIVHDLNSTPLPIADASMDLVVAKDVLEHVDYVPVLRELHRILKPGGKLEVQVPHFTSASNFIDPTHLHRFSIRTFDYFVVNSDVGRDYYFDFAFSKMAARQIKFLRRPLIYNFLVEPLVNAHRVTQKYYELTMLCALFPASNIAVTLIR